MIAHLDLDSFFVAVERVRNPDLSARPVIIGGRPGGNGLVAAASREARRAGIRPGTSLVQAAVLCPGAAFLDGSFDTYLAASLQVDEVLRRVSAEIEWTSIDEAFVGLSRLQTPRQAVQSLDEMLDQLRGLGLDAAFGLGHSKTVARIASRLARPRGVVHILGGYEARFLSPLKIEMLPDLDLPVARRLRARGIKRLGQLANLTESQLISLTGRAGRDLMRQAVGRDSVSVRHAALPVRPIEEQPLVPPTADRVAIADAMAVCVARLGRTLRVRGVFARSITARVRYADDRTDSRTVHLAEPSALTEVLQSAAADLVERIDRPGHLVRAVGCSASGLLDSAGAPALFPLSR